MNTLFLINSLGAGGAERALSLLLRELNKEKFICDILLLEKDEFYPLHDDLKATCLLKNKKSNIINLLLLPVLALKLKRYINKNNISIVQSHLARANYVNILAKLLRAKHHVQIVNTVAISSEYNKQDSKGIINNILIKFLYPKSDSIIVKSKAMLVDLEKSIKFKNKQSYLIYNPYDIESIVVQANKEIDEKIFNFKSDKKYLISVARFHKNKRHVDLLKALVKLPKHVELILLGEGSELNHVMALTNKYKLTDRVHFLGKVSNPYQFISRANLFILSSSAEGFPNALVEAMICKTPVIATDCLTGPREILAPNTEFTHQLAPHEAMEQTPYGILYPVGNIEALTTAITMLLDNEHLQHQYSEAAFKRAQDFSITTIIPRYKAAILAA